MSSIDLLGLQNIFDSKIFRVPDYQRGYCWTIEPNLNDFWNDIRQLGVEETHYTGMITVEEVDEKEIRSNKDMWITDIPLLDTGYKAYYIVDGQQRLLTSIIMINEILNKVKNSKFFANMKVSWWIEKILYITHENEDKSYLFGYHKDNPSYEYFKTCILEQYSSAVGTTPTETLYTHRMGTAKDFFRNKLKKYNKQKLEEIFIKLINGFKFNFYPIDKELDVYVSFETMNNRGRDLSVLELLKNRLIYLTTKLDGSSLGAGLRKDINETWKTIYSQLGKTSGKRLTDDAFLRAFCIMYFGVDKLKKESLQKYLLQREFIKERIVDSSLSKKKIRGFLKNISNASQNWAIIQDPKLLVKPHGVKDCSKWEDAQEWLEKLTRLENRSFQPMILSVLMSKPDIDGLLQLLRAVERYIFLVYKVTHRKSNTGVSQFQRLAHQFFLKANTITDLIDALNWAIDGEDDDYYYGWLDLEHFKDIIEGLFKRDPKNGYYGWTSLKYLLYEYELHLYYMNGGQRKVTWSQIDERELQETIEHIYPQDPKDEYWKSRFKGKKAKHYLHSLGNLLLLSRKKNSSFQNKPFTEKKNGKKYSYRTGSHSEVEVSKSTVWTPNKIVERGLDILKFMEERWEIDFKSYGINKKELL